MAKENIPGAVFLLVQNGKVLYQRGYGFANVARRQPVNPETTIWRIGSISKVFTATAVVQLADRGRFRLTRRREPVSHPLQGSSDVPATCDVRAPAHPYRRLRRDPARHSRGDRRRTSPARRFSRQQADSPAAARDARSAIPPTGSRSADIWSSRYRGWISRRTSHEMSGAPLGMTRTNIVVPDSLRADLAQGYEYDGGANKLAEWEWYHTTPASSINASAADMGRFIIAHLQDGRYGRTRILSESAARDMHRQHVTSHPSSPASRTVSRRRLPMASDCSSTAETSRASARSSRSSPLEASVFSSPASTSLHRLARCHSVGAARSLLPREERSSPRRFPLPATGNARPISPAPTS